MVNIVTGIIAIAGAVTFLSFYLSRISSVVFWVITIVVMALAAYDVVKTVRSERRTNEMMNDRNASR